MKPDENIKKNYQYYLDNQSDLNKKYKNKYIIIKDEKVFGIYETLEEAIIKAKELEAGTYIIQQCKDNESTQIFHTRVRFNA